MSITLRRPLTLEAFLDWERRQDLRYEFNGVQAIAMTGGTVAHSVIGTNLVRALQDQLRGKPCRAFRGDVKIIVDGRVRYPDALVTCSPVLSSADIVPEPVVVFEIISPSTANVDRIVKNQEYRATPSILHYAMIEQVQMAATVFSRNGSDWSGRVIAGAATIALPEIGVDLPLADLYAGLELDENAPED